MSKTVFLSYRRNSTGKAFAGRIHDALERRGYDVFLDVNNLGPGPWAAQILTEVPKRSHYVLVLTPNSLDRCSDPDDWVRREYELAASSKRNIVPVHEESVVISALRASTDASMQSLFSLQMVELTHVNFAKTIDRLVADYIPPHKAPSFVKRGPGTTATPSPSKSHFGLSLLATLQTPLVNRVLDLLLLAAFMVTFWSAANGNWNVFVAPIALALKGAFLLLGLSDDVVPVAQMALLTITCGIILVLLHAKEDSKFDMTKWVCGLAAVTFGVGAGGTLAFLRSIHGQRNRAN